MPVSKGLGKIWAMDFFDESSAIITIRDGQFKFVNLKTGAAQNINGMPDDFSAGGQGGLLHVKLHPEFKKNKLMEPRFVF